MNTGKRMLTMAVAGMAIGLAGGLVALQGCQSGGSLPARYPDGRPLEAEALAGRQVYLRRCSTCHTALPIKRFTVEQWRKELEPMARLSGLDVTQRRAVRRYIESQLGRSLE